MDPIDELAQSLPAEVLVTDPDIMRSYCRDQAALVSCGTPVAVARPTSTEQVSEIMRWATRHRVVVVPRGAGTGLSGGANAIDGGLVISLDQMTAIREINAADQVAVAEAGVINADLGRAVREHGLF
jgi:glycolate oxidase